MGSPKEEERRSDREDEVLLKISKPFAVAVFAVTRGEFTRFVTTKKYAMDGGCFVYEGSQWKNQPDRSWESPGFAQDDRHPVTCVSWDDAKGYTKWLTSITGKTYRLLSESEREYVTRAGTSTPYWWGTTISRQQANFAAKATVPVDAFAPNAWGLFNVHGNIWEWTEDCWDEENEGNPGDGRPRVSHNCGTRVVRGGSWHEGVGPLRSAYRVGFNSAHRYAYQGFRVARTLP
jgi:formylglycine-generating enzyme required for sulfatase activity